jgi:hypothetical protein
MDIREKRDLSVIWLDQKIQNVFILPLSLN